MALHELVKEAHHTPGLLLNYHSSRKLASMCDRRAAAAAAE